MLARLRAHLTYANVISTLCLFVVAVSALFASTATAAGAVYLGHIKGVPGVTQFDLKVSKANSGKRFVDKVYFNGSATCEDGLHTVATEPTFYPPDNRVRDGAFAVGVDYPGADFLRVEGELKSGGRAVGIYKQQVTFVQPAGTCKTGKLKWVAKRL